MAVDISAYSLVAAARAAEPLMAAAGGGSIVTMTYLGGERAVPHYNVMGVAKATLDASVKYLAWDLGEKEIRVNAVSAGPVRTLAARSIAGFTEMESMFVERAPLRRHIDADDVGAGGRVPALRRREERDRDDALRRRGLSLDGHVAHRDAVAEDRRRRGRRGGAATPGRPAPTSAAARSGRRSAARRSSSRAAAHVGACIE